MTNSLFTEKQIAMFILSPLKIAEAIYTLGKEIGIQRDISERVSNTFCEQSEFEEYKGKGYIDGYDSRRTFNGNFGTPLQYYYKHRAQDEISWLCRIQKDVMKKLMEKFEIKPLGHHYFKSEGTNKDFYQIGRFSFHIKYIPTIADNLLGTIDKVPRLDKRSMSFEKAKQLLHKFLSD